MTNAASLINNIFKSKPLIDEETALWISDTFTWALQHFDADEFYKNSQLVQPNNHFFPGKVDSVHGLADNIFKHTLAYAGLTHWPFQLQTPEAFAGLPPPYLEQDTQALVERNSVNSSKQLIPSEQALFLSYKPQQTGKPEDLSSTFAHLLAQHVCMQTKLMPPGGPEFFSAGTEVLAIFMGFGVMFANSAFTYKGGCGSCYNPHANRQSTLSEEEATFALALYCQLKKIPNREATRYLKGHLKGGYKRAVKQIGNMPSLAPTTTTYY